MDYDSTAIADSYDAARDRPADQKAELLSFFREHAPASEVALIVDLGCGTGRFSQALAALYNARVVGLDPSETMVAQARKKLTDDRLSFQLASAERISFEPASVDLIFLSMVFHHLPDPAQAVRECARVLGKGKYVCLRNTTADETESYPYLEFFPSIRGIIDTALTPRDQLIGVFSAAGFEVAAQRVTWHEIAEDWQAFADKIALRADSFVARLDDNEFERGLEALKRHAKTAPKDERIGINLDQFVFRRR